MDEYWIEQADGSWAPESALIGITGHPFKSMGRNVQIAPTVFFAHPEEVVIGNNVRIDGFCSFTTSMEIGDYVHIGSFVSVIGGKDSKLVMEDFSGLSAGCRIVCGSDDYFEGMSNPTVPIEYRPKCRHGTVRFSRHCIAGTNTVVHPDVVLAEGACTGSCTLVTKSLLEEWTVYKGCPAVRYKKRDALKILSDEASLHFMEQTK